MENTVIYLVGFPGTGKYTIAKEICKQSENFRLVDNHLINNPVFSVIHYDGTTLLPEEVWKNTNIIREVVLDTLINISPKEYSFVLTNQLIESDPDDHKIFNSIQKMAEAREATFVPVCLTCDVEEMERRIIGADRAERMKQTDVSAPRKFIETEDIINIKHVNLLSLDVTTLSQEKAAEKILEHAQNARNADGRED